MSDRDALAREMMKAAGDSEIAPYNTAATVALRHIEAARAEERERLEIEIESLKAKLVATVNDACRLFLMGAGSPAPAAPSTRPCDYPVCSARGAGHPLACRCSPAPAAPVVWTDAQVEAASRSFIDSGIYVDRNTIRLDRNTIRAALEAASREVSDE